MGDIPKILAHYGVELAGNKTCCPIPSHGGENTPSFTYYEDDDTWNCFGKCSSSSNIKSGGDPVSLIQAMEHPIAFKDAKAKYKEITGKEFKISAKREKKITAPTYRQPLVVGVMRDLASKTVYQDLMYRGISKETDEFFKHRSEVKNGKVVSRYYPETNSDGAFTGFKCRIHPKNFSHGKIGTTGVGSQLSGQFCYKAPIKFLLIVGGEEDKCAAWQMLEDYRKKRISKGKGDYVVAHVVSPTSGEGAAAKQVANNIDFVNGYDVVVVGMDNDKAGKEAAKQVAKVISPDKVKIATWSGKDPNQMLLDGKSTQFISDFYSAKWVVKSQAKTGSQAALDMGEYLTTPKIGLPEHLGPLQKSMRGGFRGSGFVGNIIGQTSIGKTSFVDTLIYYWAMHKDIRPVIVSVERSAEELLIDLLSLHIGVNLAYIEDGVEAAKFTPI